MANNLGLTAIVSLMVVSCASRHKIAGWNVCSTHGPVVVGHSAWEIVGGPGARGLSRHCGELRRVTVEPCLRNLFGDGCSTSAWSSAATDRPARTLRTVEVTGRVSTSDCIGAVELESDDSWLVGLVAEDGPAAIYLVELTGPGPSAALAVERLSTFDYAAIDWKVDVAETSVGASAHISGRIDVCATRGLLVVARSGREGAVLLDWRREP